MLLFFRFHRRRRVLLFSWYSSTNCVCMFFISKKNSNKNLKNLKIFPKIHRTPFHTLTVTDPAGKIDADFLGCLPLPSHPRRSSSACPCCAKTANAFRSFAESLARAIEEKSETKIGFQKRLKTTETTTTTTSMVALSDAEKREESLLVEDEASCVQRWLSFEHGKRDELLRREIELYRKLIQRELSEEGGSKNGPKGRRRRRRRRRRFCSYSWMGVQTPAAMRMGRSRIPVAKAARRKLRRICDDG